MTAGSDRVLAVGAVRTGLCSGMVACVVQVTLRSATAGRRLQSGAALSTLDVVREYSLAGSTNAAMTLTDLATQALAPVGGNVTIAELSAVSASAVVTAMGTPATSGVDEAFSANAQISDEINLRLPSTTVTINQVAVRMPPRPPLFPLTLDCCGPLRRRRSRSCSLAA